VNRLDHMAATTKVYKLDPGKLGEGERRDVHIVLDRGGAEDEDVESRAENARPM
jgi:hypothetical protein